MRATAEGLVFFSSSFWKMQKLLFMEVCGEKGLLLALSRRSLWIYTTRWWWSSHGQPDTRSSLSSPPSLYILCRLSLCICSIYTCVSMCVYIYELLSSRLARTVRYYLPPPLAFASLSLYVYMLFESNSSRFHVVHLLSFCYYYYYLNILSPSSYI